MKLNLESEACLSGGDCSALIGIISSIDSEVAYLSGIGYDPMIEPIYDIEGGHFSALSYSKPSEYEVKLVKVPWMPKISVQDNCDPKSGVCDCIHQPMKFTRNLSVFSGGIPMTDSVQIKPLIPFKCKPKTPVPVQRIMLDSDCLIIRVDRIDRGPCVTNLLSDTSIKARASDYSVIMLRGEEHYEMNFLSSGGLIRKKIDFLSSAKGELEDSLRREVSHASEVINKQSISISDIVDYNRKLNWVLAVAIISAIFSVTSHIGALRTLLYAMLHKRANEVGGELTCFERLLCVKLPRERQSHSRMIRCFKEDEISYELSACVPRDCLVAENGRAVVIINGMKVEVGRSWSDVGRCVSCSCEDPLLMKIVEVDSPSDTVITMETHKYLKLAGVDEASSTSL